jgi:S1-C subfamily serine protease
MAQVARISVGVAIGVLIGTALIAGALFAFSGGTALKTLTSSGSLISGLSTAPAAILSSGTTAPPDEATDHPAAVVPAPSAVPASDEDPGAAAQTQVLVLENTLIELYERVLPSVVGVMAREDTGGSTSPGGSSGSGIIVDESGLVLTNNHVVSRVTSAVVRLYDGSEYDATVTGRDVSNDLALLAIEDPPAGLMTAVLGDSDAVRVGQIAIAIGSPFGLQGSLTTGIISSLDRTRIGATSRPMRDMIQTDADINPGNSGGPLLNSNGEVIGINTVIQSPVRGSVGIGFSVPINSAKRVMSKLETGEEIKYPWLGISGLPVNNRIAKEFGLDIEAGIYVIRVVDGGPAAQGGLRGDSATTSATEPAKDGDVIVEIDGQSISSISEIGSYIDRLEVGDEVELTVVRDGEEIALTIVLGEWPELPTS